ncbi:HIRAN domain-containing protein [Clostridium sp.]|uniref:HIRAN domain-containing protein n=1 Tax=Clostridium sp. TaxID=1506 RepID=UPI00283D4B1A|nr:HIRAN domain-containing protein [Clostridium sp.]MDR3595565.1 HIRAN domain-containing protein [Clostridium sp.]
MVKKSKENFTDNKKSIYYDLKEFRDRNPGVLYSYQDFETAGIREFKSITKKIRPLEDYEKNRLANELMRILNTDINNNNELKNVSGYITLNPIINYYDSFIKLFKVSISTNEEMFLKMKDGINQLIKNSAYSEEIKLGLLLAPICDVEEIEEILDVFSIHNDYLFYTLKAYEYMENYNDTVFELSKKSKGYGKLFCVINLRPTTNEITKWMIEEGSDNNLAVTELLSYTMLSLELLDYFENTKFDTEELEVVSRSFSMLLSDYGLDEIKDSVKVCNKVLEVIEDSGNGIYSLYAVISILYSIEANIIDEYKSKKNLSSYNFNKDYKEIIETCKKICKKDMWNKVIAKEVTNIEIESSVLISCAEKNKYKLKKKEFEMILKRDYTNALLYKYAFSVGNKAIKKSAFELGLQSLPLNQILSGQDELKIDNVTYDDIAQICFFIIIKYSQYEDFKDRYKELNLQALKSPLIETRIQAATNLQRFKEEFDEFDIEMLNDFINSEMVGNIRRLLNGLIFKTNNKEKKYVEVSDKMHVDIHVKDIYLTTTNVAGTNYIDLSEVYNSLFVQDIVYLRREFDNPYDSDAIQVITTEGYVIGYISRENNFILKNLIDKGKYLYGKVDKISDDYSNISIKIYLSYKDVIEEITNTLSLLSGEREVYLQ